MLFSNVCGKYFVHLAVGVIFILFCLVHFSTSHSSHISLDDGVCNVSWSIVNSTIAFSVIARSTGWVALSLNTDKTHSGSDLYFAFHYGRSRRLILKDCKVPEDGHYIMQDANSASNVHLKRGAIADQPGIMSVMFHRKTNTRDVQDIIIKPGVIYMQCATGPENFLRGELHKFFIANAVDDLLWTEPIGVSFMHNVEPTTDKTTTKSKNVTKPDENMHSENNTSHEGTTKSKNDHIKSDKFYDLQPILVLLTVSGIITSVIVIIVYCKCSQRNTHARKDMSVAFYKGSSSWSDTDEGDETMAFINNNVKNM